MYSDSALSVSPRGIHNTEKKTRETLIKLINPCKEFMYGVNSEVTSITKCRQEASLSMETGQRTEEKEIKVYWSFGLGDGQVSCSLPC